MPSYLNAFDQLHEIVGLAAVIGTGLAALCLGTTPVRAAGALQLIDGIGIAALTAIFPYQTAFLTSDVRALAMWSAYALLTMRWSGRWLIALTSLQGCAVLVRGSFWLDDAPPRATTALILNTTGWLMIFILGAATLAHLKGPTRKTA